MKATELMIGDWVNLKNGKVIMPCQVTVIGHSTQDRDDIGTTVCVDLSKEFPTCIFDMDVITPIPLTPEILEKNGFVKELDSDGIHYRFTLIQGCSQFSLLYARSVFQWLYPIDFKYVHELQHALKLCGIDKQIEL